MQLSQRFALPHRLINQLLNFGVNNRKAVYSDVGHHQQRRHQDQSEHQHFVGEFEIFHGNTCSKSVPETERKRSGTSGQVLFNYRKKSARIQNDDQFIVQLADGIN